MAASKTASNMKDKELEDKLTHVLGQKLNRQLLYYLDICTRCAICKEACHIYRAARRPEHVPSYRAEALRRIYKRYFTPAGKYLPGLGEASGIDEQSLEELRQAAFTCTGCRRCMVYCPFGIDITWLNSVAKAMLVAAGKAPEILEQLTDAAIIKGENIGLYKDLMIDQIKELEAELKEKTKDPRATIPIDKEGADVLYVALAGAHSILLAAVVFSLAKENWTLSLFEASNYGYFLGDTKRAHQVEIGRAHV
jgi:Fe-S oxidoreductase